MKWWTTAQDIAGKTTSISEGTNVGRSTIVVPGIGSESRPYAYRSASLRWALHSKATLPSPLYVDAPLEYGAHRLPPAPGLDRHRLRQAGNPLPLLQHPRLEHLPVPLLTGQNKADLTRCAENILLAREAHFPRHHRRPL